MKFRVGLTQTVIEVGWIYVDASSCDEAETLALEAARGDVDGVTTHWRFYETTGDILVTTINELEGEN
jgi:hypothetical protein